MTTIEFRDSLVNAAGFPLTVETAYRSYAAYAGIHDVSFGRGTENPYLRPELWLNAAPARWTIDSTGIYAEAATGISDIFSKDAVGGVKIPHSTTLTFMASGEGGLYLKRTDATNYFYVAWGAGRIEIIDFYPGSNGMLTSFPCDVSGEMEITVMFREFQYSSLETDRWVNISVWIDGEHICAGTKKIGLRNLGKGLGFRVGHDATLLWAQTFHPVMSAPLEWGSLDPNEAPMEGLSRAIGERHLKQWMRFDGTLRVVRPEKGNVNFSLGHPHWHEVKIEKDERQQINHIRVWGAFHQAEAYDSELASTYGHRFAEVNNPNLLTYEECVEEARIILEKIKADADRISFSMPFQVFIEPEDIIKSPKGIYVVDTGDVRPEDKHNYMTVNGRRYLYV